MGVKRNVLLTSRTNKSKENIDEDVSYQDVCRLPTERRNQIPADLVSPGLREDLKSSINFPSTHEVQIILVNPNNSFSRS